MTKTARNVLCVQLLVPRSYTSYVEPLYLGRDTSVDAFIKATAGRIDGKELFVFFKERNVIAREALNLVDVLDGLVRTMAGNLAGCRWKHATQFLVVALYGASKNKAKTRDTSQRPVSKTTTSIHLAYAMTISYTYHKGRVEIKFATGKHLRLLHGLIRLVVKPRISLGASHQRLGTSDQTNDTGNQEVTAFKVQRSGGGGRSSGRLGWNGSKCRGNGGEQ
jgi:hypothetical protein